MNPSMNSFSHYSFGAVWEWMFTNLAGIDHAAPGFDQIVIKPNPQTAGSNPEHPAIDWVNAQYDSIRGKIASRWRREADRFVLEVIIPANTRATVFIPAESAAAITESGRPLEEVREVRVLGAESGRVRVSVGCGKYRFVSSQ